MALKSRYTLEQIEAMDLISFFRESTFDDIYHSVKILRVARYARESTKHEDQQKALENQIERLDDMIYRNMNYTMQDRHRYTERGISGRTVDSRVAFNLMLDAAKRHEFDVIIVQDICRFARNLKELLIYIDTLKEYEVGVLILDGQYWTFNLSETDIIRIAVDGGMAQGESMRTSKRVSNGIQSYRDRGQLVVSKLFGYTLIKAVERKDNTLKVHPENGLTVKKIFELYTHPDASKRMGSARIANYLNANGYKTDAGDLSWTPSKINRVLKNEKYMGYIMYGKFKVVDTMKKKKIATKVKPIREDIYDEEGNLTKKCNLIKGDWEPLVTEEVWWLARKIQDGRAAEYIYSKRGNMVNGLRESVDMIANKSFCQCGYSRSPQYLHVAKDGKEAQFRYTCRWQINAKTPQYRADHKLQPIPNLCTLGAVSEMKLWLMSLKVFEYVFGDRKEDILTTLKYIEEYKRQTAGSDDGKTLKDLQDELEKVISQIDKLYLEKLSDEIDATMYKRLSQTLTEKQKVLERGIQDRQQQEARDTRQLFDLKAISDRLDTYVDFTGKRVCNEMIDVFVERIIYRENDEFLWEMNLSGVTSDSRKYRIKEYSEEYSNYLKSDDNFHIIHKFLIPVEECKEFVETVCERRFVPKFWKSIIVKIAVK